MSTSRLADLRVRAAASQVVGLDVRGPVSQALARAGVAVPPAPLADEAGETETAVPASASAASQSEALTARRVVKPFRNEPWPTTRPKKAEAPKTLSGLTADERRVHKILMDTLAIDNARDGMSNGLSYAEKKRLPTLDLGFIDAQIASMAPGPSMAGMRWVLVAMAVGAAVPLAFVTGKPVPETVLMLFLVAVAAGSLLTRRGHVASGPQRLAIYQALRELALLADPDNVTSDALRQADSVIDRLADADDAPRLRLTDVPAPSASAGRTRARS